MTPEAKRHIRLTVNGEVVEAEVPVRRHLVDFLRLDLGLTGSHLGCEHGVCGACTVRVGGVPVRGCLMLAVQADGAEVETIEGLTASGEIADLQARFVTRNALQCGFCTPGMLIATAELLKSARTPSREQVREFISGNYCRCTRISRDRRCDHGNDRGARRAIGRGRLIWRTPKPVHRLLRAAAAFRAPPRRAFVAGAGRYTDDIAPARLIHVAFVRSPYAHAKITDIDLGAARAVPGVFGIFTAADLAGGVSALRDQMGQFARAQIAAAKRASGGAGHLAGRAHRRRGRAVACRS